MNKKLEEIHKLLPDNINGEITEGNMRRCFTLVFEGTYSKADIPNDDRTYILKADGGLLDADSLGKNIGNSDLQVPAGTVRTLNVTGARFQVQGLENKKQDASFNKKIKINDAGQMAYSDEADITLNIPENFTGQPSVGSMTITVNHTYPNQIPERPAFADELKNIMAEYNNIIFTQINQGDWVIKTKDNKGISTNRTYTDGSFYLNGSDPEFNPYAATEEVANITAPGILLPNDKNWILRVSEALQMYFMGGVFWRGYVVEKTALLHMD